MRRIVSRAVFSLAVVMLAGTGCRAGSAPGVPIEPVGDPSSTSREVVRVYDGDTIVVAAPEETVRLIGLNAPERERPLYEESRDFLQALVGDTWVRLGADVETHDRHGRRLAYVFLPDGTHVNLEIVRLGYAQALTVPPNVAYADAFRTAEREARSSGRGLWQPSPVVLAIDDIEPNPPGPDEANLNGEWVQVRNTGAVSVDLGGITLSDEGNNTFSFPGYQLAPGASVRVYSGEGRPAKGRLYWDHGVPVWNNDGDTALLRDAAGRFIDAFSYQP